MSVTFCRDYEPPATAASYAAAAGDEGAPRPAGDYQGMFDPGTANDLSISAASGDGARLFAGGRRGGGLLLLAAVGALIYFGTRKN